MNAIAVLGHCNSVLLSTLSSHLLTLNMKKRKTKTVQNYMLTLNTYTWYTVKRKQLFEWKQSNKIWERIFSVHLKYHASFIHLFICIVNGMLHLIKREREHENERQWKEKKIISKKKKQNKHVIDFVEIFVFQTCSLAYRIPILYFVSQLWKPSFKSILGDIFCSEAHRNRNNNKIRKRKK